MKILLAIAIGICAESIPAQPNVWQHASRRLTASSERRYIEKKIHRLTVPQSQQKSVFRLLNARSDIQSCLGDDPAFFEKLRYETVPLSPAANVLVEAGPGCARGGQGSNGSMWLVRFDGSKATLLASPQVGFEGWIYSIEPTTSNGYRDIIVGWHMSAFESALSYLRYSGSSYRSIAAANLLTDERGISRIVPEKR